jgi:hypothetical protein
LLRLRGLITPEEGAQTTLHCALRAPASESGLYYSDCRPVTPARNGRDMALAQELWQRSEAWTR